MIGDVVFYRLTGHQAAAINGHQFASPPDRAYMEPGQILPAIVVADSGDGTVNLQVFLNGSGSIWVTGCHGGGRPGQWFPRQFTR